MAAHARTDRSKLGVGSNGLSAAESGLYLAPHAVQTLNPGGEALPKGEAWEGSQGAGLAHRSPTVKAERYLTALARPKRNQIGLMTLRFTPLIYRKQRQLCFPVSV